MSVIWELIAPSQPDEFWCDQCEQSYVGGCPHYDEARVAAEQAETDSREPATAF